MRQRGLSYPQTPPPTPPPLQFTDGLVYDKVVYCMIYYDGSEHLLRPEMLALPRVYKRLTRRVQVGMLASSYHLQIYYESNHYPETHQSYCIIYFNREIHHQRPSFISLKYTYTHIRLRNVSVLNNFEKQLRRPLQGEHEAKAMR